MKKILYILSYKVCLLFLLIFFYSCDNHTKNEPNKTNKISSYYLKLIAEDDTTLKLSNLINNIEYIKLETRKSAYLGKIVQLDISENNIFILDNTYKIFKFDGFGKFVKLVGRIGKGPGEYTEPLSITLFQKKKILAVYDVANLKVILFDFSGDYINEFKISSFPLKIAALGDSLIAAAIPYPDVIGNDYFSVNVYNLKGKLVRKLISRKKELQKSNNANSSVIEGRILLQNTNGLLKFWEMNLDTIYDIFPDLTVKPEYTLINGSKEDKTVLNNIGEHGIWYGKILDFKKYTFISPCIYNNKVKHLIIDKKTKKGYNFMVYKNIDMSLQLKYGIMNDIDGGWPIIPIKKTTIGKAYCTFYGQELKKEINSDFFKNQPVTDTVKRNELDSLLNISTIYDNPIIMLVNLK